MNDNETVEEVLAEFGKNIELMRKCKCVGVSLWNCLKYKLRIEAAYKRKLSAKNDEILNLRKSLDRVMEVTGDCRKCEECGDETCPWFGEPDGCNNREGRELFLAGKLVDPLKMKDDKIMSLRELVGEMAVGLSGALDIIGNVAEYIEVDCGTALRVETYRALVAKAREVVR